jgi:DNA-binding transcriptional ArsR family regulator
VRELADALPISRPAVSRHLRLLKDAGLVTDRAEGTRRLYRLHDEGIAAVQAYLQQVWGDAAARFKLLAGGASATAAAEPASPSTTRAPR